MTRDPHTTSTALFTQVQISPAGHTTHVPELSERAERQQQTRLLQDILTAQDRQNALLNTPALLPRAASSSSPPTF